MQRCSVPAASLQGSETNDLKAAVEDLKEVLRQEPNSRHGLFFMADAQARLGQVDQVRAFAGDLLLFRIVDHRLRLAETRCDVREPRRGEPATDRPSGRAPDGEHAIGAAHSNGGEL